MRTSSSRTLSRETCCKLLAFSLNSSCRFSIKGKIKLGYEANGAHKAQSIFLESDTRISHGAQYPRLNILLSFIRVYQMSFRIIQGYGVYGEIPACQVFFEGMSEGDCVRAPLVAVGAFRAIRA